ncbi:MAG: response regulator [Ignavibacteria bacterium]|nr:response regulator [Ignavibacteria bacterium]
MSILSLFLFLCVIEKMVHNNNGFFDVESEVGKGTETLLDVEDEELLRDFVKTMLESVGYTVYEARNGEEAVEVYGQKNNEIQLVIKYMGLPRLSGGEEFYKLKEINANVKVMLASGLVEPSVKSELLKRGAKAFIQKPYEVHQLLKQVRGVLDAK